MFRSEQTKMKPTKKQASVEEILPAIGKWVKGYGHIEIGDQESFGFVARALDFGGLVFESNKPKTLAEAMASLDRRLPKCFRENE